MIPASFDYHAPKTLDEAVALLARLGDTAKILAGGQSLIPAMRFRLASPEALIDLGRIRDLAYVEERGDHLAIGALTREHALEASAAVAKSYPLLLDTAKVIADPLVRNKATVGGNLAHADPASELPAVVVALDGELVLSSRSGERVVPAEEFFLGPFTTARRADELVTEVRLTTAQGGTFIEFARRAGDFALVGVCIADGRIGICGASPVPVRARRAEAALAAGESPERVGAAAAGDVDPWDDVHGSAEYRRHVVATLVRRAVA